MLQENQLVVLAVVAGRPVRPAEAAAVLSEDVETVVTAVEELVDAGSLTETPAGFKATSATDISMTRRIEMAGLWADHLMAAGASDAETGQALVQAGRFEEALPLLVAAADAGDTDAADRALVIHDDEGGLTPDDEGRLRLMRARHRRAEGRSAEAAADVELAVRRLDGDDQIDALGFAAAIADDRQRPQESEVMAALAAERAAHIGHLDKLGSILTLQGRSLSRIGFPAEGDAVQERGQALIDEHGHEIQRFYGRMNRAWVLLDRGEAAEAEVAFARLRDDALDVEGEIGLADKEAYWARAAFRTGRGSEAHDSAESSMSRARRLDAPAPEFIALLAMAEGALLYRRYDDALEAADVALEVVRRHLPAWENVVTQVRARALAGLGRMSEARDEIERALELCPEGPDGWRWRTHCTATRLRLTDENAPWPQREAEDLTDALLQARLYEAAVELMTERARREDDPELGEQAAALAVKLGNPALATEAADAAGMWSAAEARPIGRMVRATSRRLPQGWWETWRTSPAVRAAIDLPEPDPGDAEQLTSTIDEALAMAGLSGVAEVLSPAQRRSAGLVRRREVRRRRRWPALVAAGVGVVALSAATALGVGLLQRDVEETALPTTTTTAPTTTTTRLEDKVVPLPDRNGGLFGSSEARGGNGRTGELKGGGVSDPQGIYWPPQSLGGALSFQPVSEGKYLYVGVSGTETLTAIYQETGEVFFEESRFGGEVEAPPAIVERETEGGLERLLVFTTDEGRLVFRNSQQANSIPEELPLPAGRRAKGTPVVTEDQIVVVATEGGLVLGYAPSGEARREALWQYPAADVEPAGPFDSAPAYADGVVYAIDRDNLLHQVDARTEPGTAVCPPVDIRGQALGGPIVTESLVLAVLNSGIIWKYPRDTCVQGAPPQIPFDRAFTVTPAVAAGRIYVDAVGRLEAWDLETGGYLEVFPPDISEQLNIVTDPVVANGIVYFATGDGRLFALSAETLESVWSEPFQLDGRPAGPPAIVDYALFVPLTDGTVVAIAGEPPE